MPQPRPARRARARPRRLSPVRGRGVRRAGFPGIIGSTRRTGVSHGGQDEQGRAATRTGSADSGEDGGDDGGGDGGRRGAGHRSARRLVSRAGGRTRGRIRGAARDRAAGGVRRQQLGRDRRRAGPPTLPQDRADRRRPGPRGADGGDPVGPPAPGLLPRRPAGRRGGARPARRRPVLLQRRPAARRLAPLLRRRGRHQPAHRRDRVAHAGRGLPRRPHGDVARRAEGGGQRLDRRDRPRAARAGRQEGGPLRLRGHPARERLPRRRRHDPARQHRHGLHAHGPAGPRHQQGGARARARGRPDGEGSCAATTCAPSSTGWGWRTSVRPCVR